LYYFVVEMKIIMSRKKIVVLDGYTLNPGDLCWDELGKLGDTVVYERTNQDQTFERVKDAHIVITNKVIIDRKLMSELTNLKYIGVLATGYNVVDTVAANDLGVIVTNIPAYSTESVAQMVFAHILNFTQRVGLHSDSVKSGDWVNSKDFMYSLTPQTELSGKVLGIIGFGKIGSAVARIGEAFDMDIIFNNRSKKHRLSGGKKQVELEEIFKSGDFISINCPLTDENAGFVNNSLLNLAKQSVFIVNTGRGPLLNETDVAEALNAGKIAGLGADVLSTEPPLPDNPLLTAKNCFITPHMAWATREARIRLMEIAVGNVRSFLNGNPVNVVS
ncbi:MAG: D-2-hydroxyacid dehydrogenase, partial [Prolixibacteraceae bacterium]|nr:D-2-hydroxyacid dehydrogenase [Prolixibacteraceae bacterium]